VNQHNKEDNKHKAPKKENTIRGGPLKQLTLSAMFATAFTPSQGKCLKTYQHTSRTNNEIKDHYGTDVRQEDLAHRHNHKKKEFIS
jgi:malic enzyme